VVEGVGIGVTVVDVRGRADWFVVFP